jgi:hypothetical protein
LLSITGIGGETNSWLVTQVKKPSATIGEVSHKYLNHTFYYPGRVEWDTVNATLVDPVSPNAAGLMANVLERCGYVLPGNINVTDAITKKKAVEELGAVTISQFGSDKSDVVEKWELVNAFITNIDWGELNYDSDDLTNITLTMRYDYAKLTTPQGQNDREAGKNQGEAKALDKGEYFKPSTLVGSS